MFPCGPVKAGSQGISLATTQEEMSVSTRAKREKPAVGGEQFDSLESLKRRVRSIVSAYGDGDMMSETDFRFVKDLVLTRHYSPCAKFVPGLESQVIGIRVRHDSAKHFIDKWDVNHCFVVYAPGHVELDEINFSWVVCCMTESAKRKRFVSSAMRSAVDSQLLDFKQTQKWRIECPVRGVPFAWGGHPSSPDFPEVDHFPIPFHKIRDLFFESTSESFDSIETVPSDRGGHVFADAEKLAAWQEFHLRRARYRILTKKANSTSWRNAITGEANGF